MTLLVLWACSEPFAVRDPSGEPVPGDSGASVGGEDTQDSGVASEPLELCVNEFMPENASSIQDDVLAWPDWIELHNPGNVAIDLDGWSITDDRLEPDKHMFEGGLVIPARGYEVLWADEWPSRGIDHLGFKLDVEGGEIALYAPDGRGSIVTYGPMSADFSVARVPDCCTGDACFAYDFRGSPGASNVEPVYADVPLLAAGSTWKYWDAGTSPGDGWASAGFDDSAWAIGAGPLGYGDTHQVTTIGYGGVDAAKHITTWFRTTVDAPAITLATLTIGLLRDDGAVVYLNGVEVVRDNLPEGEITAATLASGSVGSADETAYWEYELDPAAIQGGTNTIAVELHQAASTSSDLGFDLSLAGQVLVTE